MANDIWNQIDKEKHDFNNHICAFLDILGYKEKSKEFYSGHLNIYGRIKRALIQAGLEKNRDHSPDGIYTQIFSDSIIVHTEEKNLDLLLNYVATLVTFFSYEELYLRGGISEGKFFDHFEANNNFSFFSSEALIKAYEFETKAIFPLIEIDETLVKKVKNHKILCKFNNKIILNFARYAINEFGSNESDIISELNDIEELLITTKAIKVKEKIQWIINYYLWFIKISNEKYTGFDLTNFEKFKIYINLDFNFDEDYR